MAVYTQLTSADASTLARAHGLPEPLATIPIAAGSVNTNYFLVLPQGRVFARVYEEQDASGVAYEWALLDHLVAAGVPVPRRIEGPGPGELRVGGKPTALFEEVFGRELKQREITPAVAEEVGRSLGAVHRSVADFGWRREGRFRRADLRGRLDRAASHGRPELEATIARLRALLDELDATEPTELPRGVTHGDLFRDNVRFEGDRVVALLDWESAADGVFLYDLAVTLLAFCCGEALDDRLMRAMVYGYGQERALLDSEWRALRYQLRAAAARFTTTRITDFYLREEGVGERVMRDYRRFLARLETVTARSAEAWIDVLRT